MVQLMASPVGNRIRELRKQRGLTQGQIAAFAGVTRGWLSLVESGDTPNPGGERLDRVARILGVSSRYLLTGTDEPEPEPRSYADLLAQAEAVRPYEVLVYDKLPALHAGAGNVAPVQVVYLPALP